MGMRDQITKAIVDRIKVFHASPHDFDKFDLSKIGTGQGAQSYGHGIYFAENPKVSGLGGQYWDEFTRGMQRNVSGERDALAYDAILEAGGDRAKAIDILRRGREKIDEAGPFNNLDRYTRQMRDYKDAINRLEQGNQVGARVYEVNINARPEQFLDWDKPRAAQSEEVQQALNRLNPAFRGDRSMYPPSMPGREIYRRAYDPVIASEKMREAGIPGIRYLDQGSRGYVDPAILREKLATAERNLAEWGSPESKAKWIQGPESHASFVRTYQDEVADLRQRIAEAATQKPTYNYVVNNPDIIEIMKKYAVPGAAVPAMGELARQDLYGQPQ